VSAQPLAQFMPLRDLASGDFAGASMWMASHPIGEGSQAALVVHLVQPALSSVAHAFHGTAEQPEAALAHAAIKTLATYAGAALPASDGTIRWLTRRESEVLEQLTLGYSIREIAELLQLSHHTVQDHVKHLHTKLEANNRGELVARALGRRAR
jgi:DNA-binding CsgD family transcriptional regulator